MAPSSWEIERILCHLQETQALVKYKVIIATHLFHSQHCDCLEQYNMEFSQRRILREFLNYKAEFITHATITFWSCRTENTILVNTTFAPCWVGSNLPNKVFTVPSRVTQPSDILWSKNSLQKSNCNYQL